MGRSSALALAVLGLLAACGTCIPEASALEVAHGAASLDGALDAHASRDLLKKRRKKKKTKKVKKTKKNVAQSFAQNVNNEGVLINQQTTANIDGDGNAVVGGFTSPVFNAVVSVGEDEDDNNRKLLTVRRDGSARDLLKKRKRKNKKVKKVKKKNIKKAESVAINDNQSGVLINQQTTANIEGDNNAVVGGFTSPVFNAVLDFGEDEDDNNRKLLSIRGGGDWSARDLLKKKRKNKKVKKVKKKKIKKAESVSFNSNDEGVLINQPTTVLAEGDGNGVLGAETSPVFNANVDIGDIFLD